MLLMRWIDSIVRLPVMLYSVSTEEVKLATKRNLKRLRAVMEQYGVSTQEVAKILDVSTGRVYGWLTEAQVTPIPTTKLRLLECELKLRKLQRRKR